jgi:hypothetical protein
MPASVVGAPWRPKYGPACSGCLRLTKSAGRLRPAQWSTAILLEEINKQRLDRIHHNA